MQEPERTTALGDRSHRTDGPPAPPAAPPAPSDGASRSAIELVVELAFDALDLSVLRRVEKRLKRKRFSLSTTRDTTCVHVSGELNTRRGRRSASALECRVGDAPQVDLPCGREVGARLGGVAAPARRQRERDV